MSIMIDPFSLGALAAVLYQSTITVTALLAVLGRTPQRRRAAGLTLRILLRSPDSGRPGALPDQDAPQ